MFLAVKAVNVNKDNKSFDMTINTEDVSYYNEVVYSDNSFAGELLKVCMKNGKEIYLNMSHSDMDKKLKGAAQVLFGNNK